jgi:hypothetical protein
MTEGEKQQAAFATLTLTAPGLRRISPPTTLDKGTPGESRGRKATGPRLLRDAGLSLARCHEGPHDRRTATGTNLTLPLGGSP